MSRGPLRFNPREAGTDELSATLVGRHALIDELERRLVEDAAAATWRHWLVVGPRGVGKSHLCEVLSRRLRARGWTLVRFPEEHYRIHGLARLIEEIFVHASGQPSPFLDEPRADVVIEKALSALRRLRTSSSRPLLVVLENLGMLLEQRMRDPADHARLRAILQHDPPFTLFATSPVWLDSTTQEGAPFYDFFQTYDLADLSADEVVELVRRRADYDLPADDPLRVSLSVPRGEAEARVRALHMLSGGNPRLVLVLYDVLRAGLSRDTRSQILQLIDDVTPYYQARLNDLSSQLQQVLTELCLAELQITPAELARRCRMETNQVTANLTKLQRLRLVEPGERVDGRSRYWVIRERLLRIWLQVRERPEASARLVFLVEFFRVWFEGDRDGAEKHARRYGEGVSVAMREGKVEEAMACIAGLEHLAAAVGSEEIDPWRVLLGSLGDEVFPQGALQAVVERLDEGEVRTRLSYRAQFNETLAHMDEGQRDRLRSAMGALRAGDRNTFHSEIAASHLYVPLLIALTNEEIHEVRVGGIHLLWHGAFGRVEWEPPFKEAADKVLRTAFRLVGGEGVSSDDVSDALRWDSETELPEYAVSAYIVLLAHSGNADQLLQTLATFKPRTLADVLTFNAVYAAARGPFLGYAGATALHEVLAYAPWAPFFRSLLRVLARRPEIFPHLLTLYDALSTTKVHEDPVAILHESWQVRTGAIPREALHPEMREAVDRFLSTQLLQDSRPLLAAEPPGTWKKPPRQRR